MNERSHRLAQQLCSVSPGGPEHGAGGGCPGVSAGRTWLELQADTLPAARPEPDPRPEHLRPPQRGNEARLRRSRSGGAEAALNACLRGQAQARVRLPAEPCWEGEGGCERTQRSTMARASSSGTVASVLLGSAQPEHATIPPGCARGMEEAGGLASPSASLRRGRGPSSVRRGRACARARPVPARLGGDVREGPIRPVEGLVAVYVVDVRAEDGHAAPPDPVHPGVPWRGGQGQSRMQAVRVGQWGGAPRRARGG